MDIIPIATPSSIGRWMIGRTTRNRQITKNRIGKPIQTCNSSSKNRRVKKSFYKCLDIITSLTISLSHAHTHTHTHTHVHTHTHLDGSGAVRVSVA